VVPGQSDHEEKEEEVYAMDETEVRLWGSYHRDGQNPWVTANIVYRKEVLFRVAHELLRLELFSLAYGEGRECPPGLFERSHFMLAVTDGLSIKENPNHYVDNPPVHRIIFCMSSDALDLSMDNPWFGRNVMPTRDSIFIRFVRVDLPILEIKRPPPRGPSHLPVSIFCTMGTVKSRAMFHIEFNLRTDYKRFMSILLNDACLGARWPSVCQHQG
jgi:hypothetical protein